MAGVAVTGSLAPGRFFEDFTPGETLISAPIEIREDTILAFAHLYDPQPFHTDPQFAEGTIFGGLIASGWQMLSETFSRMVEDGFLRPSGQPSDGLEDLRWLRPVRPGDSIHLELNVLEVATQGLPDDRGRVVFDVSALNQSNEIVMSYRYLAMVRRRMA